VLKELKEFDLESASDLRPETLFNVNPLLAGSFGEAQHIASNCAEVKGTPNERRLI
jgi:hypothetical protein